ncbi:MAG: HAD-IA family hydrolase [Candidatus Latescibacteria bacterium]|nr:HAD-IA family hydrolase [Candidatus Latescibacterota bacterium]
MQKIAHVLFDWGGVLFRFKPQRRLQVMAAASGIAAEKLHDVLWTSGFSRACDEGRYNAQEMYQTAADSLRWYPRFEPFQDMWAQAFQLDGDVWALARSLRRGVGKGILTNNPEILRQVLHRDYPQIEAHFSPILFSATHKLVKPDKRFFFLAARQAQCTLGQMLLIDDEPEYVEGAQKAGMQAILFSSVEQLTQELRDGGLLA